MKRLLKYLVAALLGLILLLAVALAAILGSEAGSRWALGLVPGLQVQGYAGRLGGAWQAERLAWSDGATELEVERPQFAWSPACLLQGALCIDRLIVERVQLRLAPGPAEPSEGPIQLPALKLPLAVRLGEVRLGSFLLDGNEQVSNVQASAHWEADGLHIDVLKAARGDLAVDLSGLLTPQGNWPLQAQGSLRLPAPGEQPWELKLQAKGELLGHLLLEADSSGYLQGHLSGDLQPLAENLPASAKITADGFRGAVRAYDTAKKPMDFVAALRTDEQGLFCDWEKMNDPDFKIFYSSGQNYQSRIALTAAMMKKAGKDVPANIDVPFSMKPVVKGLCNMDLPQETSVSTLIDKEMLKAMFAK